MMYGYGYGPASGGGLLGAALMALFGLIVLVGIVLLVVYLVRGASQHPSQHAGTSYVPPAAGAGHDAALQVARERYARGEITKEQYDEIVSTLGGTRP